MIDSKKRSLIKAISWRLIGLFVLSCIAYFVTGSLEQTGLVAIIYQVFMIALYILHERAWNSTTWGRTRGLFIQMTGLSGSGKTTLARLVQQRLRRKGIQVEVIDGDEYRAGLCSDLGFSKEDRNRNIRRLGFVAKVLARNNVVTIISAINPYDDVRKELKLLDPNGKLVYIKASLDTVKERDTKGLYRKALLPDGHPERINNFTGISDPFEPPTDVDLLIPTDSADIERSANTLEYFIMRNIT
jgi:adenylylsulfate kinase